MNHTNFKSAENLISTKRNARLSKDIRKKFLGSRDAKSSNDKALRIVLYSHDTMGLGHMRRNLLIAKKIKKSFKKVSILVIAGAKEAGMFAQSSEIDCLTLPAFQKRRDGSYKSRFLGISADEVLKLRSKTILAAVKAYQPNLFIVDKVPGGAGGELLRTLKWLAKSHPCNCILGLRDILDDPTATVKQWRGSYSDEVIRKYFDSIWVYGDPDVFNTAVEYQFPDDIKDLCSYTGYLDSSLRIETFKDVREYCKKPFALCTVGGGQDGRDLAMAFVEAVRICNKRSVLLLGPHMPIKTRNEVRAAATGIEALNLLDYVPEADLLIRDANQVVSMGGYNTTTAILAHKKQGFIVPRVEPRVEQLLRGERLSELGHLTCVHPDKATPQVIADWLMRTPAESASNGQHKTKHQLKLGGLDQICKLIQNEFPSIKRKRVSKNGAVKNVPAPERIG